MSSTIRLPTSKACLTRSTALLGQLWNHLQSTKNRPAYPLLNGLYKLIRPSRYFKMGMLHTLEKLLQKSFSAQENSAEKQAITQTDLQNFRFHPSTQLLVKQGYYATAYQLSLARTIKDSHLFPLRQTKLSSFAPKPCNVMVGMDKYGNQYVHAFQPLAAESELYRIIEAEPSKEFALTHGMRRRMRHATPGGVAIAKAFVRPPQKFEIFIDSAHTVYLQQLAGDLIALDTLNSSFKAANVSENGGFVGLITADGSVRRYHRQQNYKQEIDLSGDSEAITISIANDGTLYIGSRQHTYITPAGSNKAIKQGPGLEQDNKIFSLSVDERFLISQRRSKRGAKKSEIVLTDLRYEGQEIILSSAQQRIQSYGTRPYSIAFSPLNALVAVGYQNGLIEIFALEKDCLSQRAKHANAGSKAAVQQQAGARLLLADIHRSSYAPILTSFTAPQYSALPPCPLVSFAQSFDQLHVTYRGRSNAVELSTLTFGIDYGISA